MSAAKPFNPGGLIFKTVAVLMALYVALILVNSVSDALELVLIEKLDRGFDVPQDQIDSNDTRQSLLGIVAMVEFVVLGIFFLRALYVLNRNARVLGADDMSTTPAMTVGWFFVPFANLFKPYQAVRDIWKASVPVAGTWQTQHSSPLIGIWWGLWICSSIAGQAAFRITLAAETLETIRLAGIVRIISGLVELPLAAVAIYLLYKLFRMQREKHERFGVATGEARVCPACGETIAAGEPVCRVCGHDLASRPAVAPLV
jgi:hypothetical protein